MKTKLATKILTGVFATTLVFGTASFANAKGPDRGRSEEAHQTQTVHDRSGDEQKNQTRVNQKVEDQNNTTSQVEDQTSTTSQAEVQKEQTDIQKGKSDNNKRDVQKGKSKDDSKGKGKKETEKKIKVTSKVGKTVEKR